ncbi:MAG: NADH-quinone oxidoreductase subunit M [Fimbriimonas sp.]|nr:NADH-quinone oxidoreductase subunit M [Fimbriimonas sp.]
MMVSLAIWLPILAGFLLLGFGRSLGSLAKSAASILMLGVLGVSVGLLAKFDSAAKGFQFSEKVDWIRSLGTSYSLGLDGISIWMFVLTAFLGLVAVLVSKPKERAGQFFGQILVLSGVLLGVFAALDLVLFYIFFELSLVPVAMLILGWGRGDRKRAATRYLAMLFGGSLLMLLAIIAVGVQYSAVTRTASMSIVDIQSVVASGKLWAGKEQLENLAFWGFLLAFLIKSPAVPGHSWLASTYESAPVGATIAGVVLKVGTYGLFRFCLPLFPHAAAANASFVTFLGVLGILYGGILAINQKNIFRVMVFSTISHVGFILIGLFSFSHVGMVGAAFQQFNHGLASAAVFVLLSFLMERGFTGEFSELGGLKRTMPVFASLFMIAMLANLGLPLTSGFVGEILAMMGSFESGYANVLGLNVGYAVAAGAGAILSASYMLYAYQRMFYGEAKSGESKDLNLNEMLIGGVFAAAIMVGGILPTFILQRMDQSVAVTGSAVKPNSGTTWAEGGGEIDASRIYAASSQGEFK